MSNVHKGSKFYKCTSCSKGFNQQFYLKLHIRSVHEGIKEFQCHHCEKKFVQKSELKIHITGQWFFNYYISSSVWMFSTGEIFCQNNQLFVFSKFQKFMAMMRIIFLGAMHEL